MYLEDQDKLNSLSDIYFSIIINEDNEKIVLKSHHLLFPVLLLWAYRDSSSFLQLVHSLVNHLENNISSKHLHQHLIALESSLPIIAFCCFLSSENCSGIKENSSDIPKLPPLKNDFVDWSAIESNSVRLGKIFAKFDAYIHESIEQAKLEGPETVTIYSLNINNFAKDILTTL